MEIKYEKARLKDLDELVGLAKRFEKDHYGIVTSENPRIGPLLKRKKEWPGIIRKYFAKCIHSKRATINVARDGGKIVGYSLLQIKKNIPVFELKEYGYVGDLYVDKKYRGKGISSHFKKMAFEWFRKKGMNAAFIGVHWGNKHARGVYEKWGFIPRHIELVRWI